MNKLTVRSVAAALLATAGLSAAGRPVAEASGPPERGEVLAAFAVDVAVPAFEEFATSTDAVVEAVGALCDSVGPDTIADANAAVAEARTAWLSTQAFWTGPVMERRSGAVIDWPIRVADIEALIDDSTAGDITPDVIANNIGADSRGFTAMRWVLEHEEAVDLLAADRWCDYLAGNAEVIATEAGLIVADWTEAWQDGPRFADVIGDPEDAQEWLGMLVNDNINLVHAIAEGPEDGDLPPTDAGADRATGLTGVAAVAEALSPLLDEDLAERLSEEIEAARATFADGDLDAGHELAEEVMATIATEVAAQLDVTIGLSDSDGDSSG